MGAVIFDFDSTLVPTESLEDLLGMALDARPAEADSVSLQQARDDIAEITRAGMDGRLSFLESLERRLAIAQPRRSHTRRLVEQLIASVPVEARDLIGWLQAAGHQVWIVSGGFTDLLRPVGNALGIPSSRIHGVQATWHDDAFAGIDRSNGFAESKVAGARRLLDDNSCWNHPAVGVGDGMTDHALFAAGLVDHFIAFTTYARRESVLATGCLQAASIHELRTKLESLLS